jgi:hypothetical protein
MNSIYESWIARAFFAVLMFLLTGICSAHMHLYPEYEDGYVVWAITLLAFYLGSMASYGALCSHNKSAEAK